ncbi:MAG TPA: serine/threonine protein kinase, partial [Cyanobacteria bacterium UBA8543]|nr:serine/threonine protein kinase [Cyanobacteria bacterium UBA8543]
METLLAGHYQIIKHLGGGGFGQTFLARDNHLPGNPWCVVKQLKPQFNDPEALATAKRLFAREAETLYRLGTHDQIPRLLA